MKKFTLLNLIMLVIFVIFTSTPVMAGGPPGGYILETGPGHVNTGNANGHGVINQGTMNTGDTYSGTMKKGINDNNVDINRSGILSGNTVEDAIIAAGDIDIDIDKSKTDNSILKNANLKKSQNGLVNQRGEDNQQGLVNQRGHDNQQGLINIKGGVHSGFSHNSGTIMKGKNIQSPHHNHSGNSHNKGIIEQSKNNSGIIVNQQNRGGRNKGNTSDDKGEDVGGQGGGGNNNIVNASIDNSTCIVEDKREHHTGTPVTFASLGTYSESKYAGANFQSTKIMTMFKDTFSYEGALEVYGKPFGEGMCETVGKSYNGRHEDDPSKEIKVFTMDDKIIPGSIEAIGFLTVKAREGKDATSFVVMQKCILSAAIMQGDAILVTKEGAETVTKSSGWGIGFNTSGSQINDQDHGRGNSYAGSGGTGWSTGKGSLEVLPWMTVQVLKFK